MTRELIHRMKEYNLKNKSQKVDLSQVAPMELKAMRYLRQMKPNKFSKMIGMSMDKMLEYENSKDALSPPEVAKRYVVGLKIMPNEHLKLKAIINGDTDQFVVNRKIPTHIKRKVYQRDSGRCSECGSEETLHYHHMKHFARGGKHEVNNITLLCNLCHIEKHKKDRIYKAMKSTYA